MIAPGRHGCISHGLSNACRTVFLPIFYTITACMTQVRTAIVRHKANMKLPHVRSRVKPNRDVFDRLGSR